MVFGMFFDTDFCIFGGLFIIDVFVRFVMKERIRGYVFVTISIDFYTCLIDLHAWPSDIDASRNLYAVTWQTF